MDNLRVINLIILLLCLAMVTLIVYHYNQDIPKEASPGEILETTAHSNPENSQGNPVKELSRQPKTGYKRVEKPENSLQKIGNALRIQVNGVLYEGHRVDLKKNKVAFYYQNDLGQNLKNLGGLKNYLDHQEVKIKFATNAGIFDPTFKPNGLYVENGKEMCSLNLKKGKGNFYMAPNGVFFITRYGSANIIQSKNYPKIAHLVKYATQSGPMLLIRGKINPTFSAKSKHKFIRSGVGLINKEQLVFMISRQAVSLYEFAKIFRDKFQCQEALYLDGAISKIYSPILKRYETEGNFGAMIAVIQ